MSDHLSRSNAEGKSLKPTRPYQSMWMGHWGGSSCNTGIAPHVDSGLSLCLESNGVPVNAKNLHVPLNDELEPSSQRLTLSLPKFPESNGDPVNTKNLHVPLNDELEPSSQRLALSLPKFPETDRNYGSASKFPSFPGTSSTGEHLGQTNNSGLVLAAPYTDRSNKLIEGRPTIAEKGKMSSFVSRYESKEHFSSTDLSIMGHTIRPSVFLCEEKIENNPSSRKLNMPMFLHNPSSSKTKLPVFMGQQFKVMQNFSKIRTETSSQYQECYALPENNPCIHKMKTSKIFATSDSTEEFDDLTRNSFPLGDTMVSTQSKVDMFENFSKFTSGGGGGLLREKSGVKLQLLSSSSDSDEKCGNKNDLNNPQPQLLKNESSAETDTMDMETLKEQNVLSGLNCSVQNKDDCVAGTTFSSISRKGKEIQTSTQNLVSSSHFLSKELPKPLCLNPRPHMVDPGSRWLKRLKLINNADSDSDSPDLGTKRSYPEEQPPPPFLRESNKRQKSKVDEKVDEKVTIREEKTNIAQCRDSLLSHSWIQRWCHNKAADTNDADTNGKTENEVICEPKKFKLESEVYENRQFPSIGAMALMGKTMSGFQPINLKRKGASYVWNN